MIAMVASRNISEASTRLGISRPTLRNRIRLKETLNGVAFPVVIKDDVWTVYGFVITKRSKITKGAIIAAWAVVTKDIPEYAIAGGIPAKVIKYRKK